MRVDDNPDMSCNRLMDSIDFLSDVRGKLRAEAYRNLPDVARDSGVPESTLKKIRSGEVKDPRISTVQALYAYFNRTTKETLHA